MLFWVTLVLYCEVSGDQRWNLSSDVCVEDLSSLFCLVILNDLGLKTSFVLQYNLIPLELFDSCLIETAKVHGKHLYNVHQLYVCILPDYMYECEDKLISPTIFL